MREILVELCEQSYGTVLILEPLNGTFLNLCRGSCIWKPLTWMLCYVLALTVFHYCCYSYIEQLSWLQMKPGSECPDTKVIVQLPLEWSVCVWGRFLANSSIVQCFDNLKLHIMPRFHVILVLWGETLRLKANLLCPPIVEMEFR